MLNNRKKEEDLISCRKNNLQGRQKSHLSIVESCEMERKEKRYNYFGFSTCFTLGSSLLEVCSMKFQQVIQTISFRSLFLIGFQKNLETLTLIPKEEATKLIFAKYFLPLVFSAFVFIIAYSFDIVDTTLFANCGAQTIVPS